MVKITRYAYRGRGVFEPAIATEDYLARVIQQYQPISRGDLAAITGIPRTTIYDQIVKLRLAGRVDVEKRFTKERGRPTVLYIVPGEGEH